MIEIYRYYFPDPKGLRREVQKGVMGGDGSEVALRQPSPGTLCHETPTFQRIENRGTSNPVYFRTAPMMAEQGGSKGAREDFKDTAPYAFWRLKNG